MYPRGSIYILPQIRSVFNYFSVHSSLKNLHGIKRLLYASQVLCQMDGR